MERAATIVCPAITTRADNDFTCQCVIESKFEFSIYVRNALSPKFKSWSSQLFLKISIY